MSSSDFRDKKQEFNTVIDLAKKGTEAKADFKGELEAWLKNPTIQSPAGKIATKIMEEHVRAKVQEKNIDIQAFLAEQANLAEYYLVQQELLKQEVEKEKDYQRYHAPDAPEKVESSSVVAPAYLAAYLAVLLSILLDKDIENLATQTKSLDEAISALDNIKQQMEQENNVTIKYKGENVILNFIEINNFINTQDKNTLSEEQLITKYLLEEKHISSPRLETLATDMTTTYLTKVRENVFTDYKNILSQIDETVIMRKSMQQLTEETQEMRTSLKAGASNEQLQAQYNQTKERNPKIQEQVNKGATLLVKVQKSLEEINNKKIKPTEPTIPEVQTQTKLQGKF